jgi:glycerol-3-phosphate O-acyltransferase
MNRKGATMHEIIKGSAWTYEQVKMRGGMIGASEVPKEASVKRCLQHLEGTFLKKGHIIEPLHNSSSKKPSTTDNKALLLLAYYRNNMIHIFLNECYVAVSLFAILRNQSRSEEDP